MYTNLFKMVGFSEDEIKEQKPRIEKVLDRIGRLDKEGIKHAEEMTRLNFTTELAGTRKLLHLLMLEFMDAVLAREERDKVIYSNMPIDSLFYQRNIMNCCPSGTESSTGFHEISSRVSYQFCSSNDFFICQHTYLDDYFKRNIKRSSYIENL